MNLVGLKEAQQSGLHIKVHVADLVKQEGAVLGRSYDSRMVFSGASKRALSVSKEL